MAYTVYNCTALTGGAARALDALSKAVLATNDRAFCVVSNILYVFSYLSTGTNAEQITTHPYTIRPDDYSDGGNWTELTPYNNVAQGQFAFPAAAAPSADPNTLDDYEEGTFTPTILLGGTPVTSYNYQDGFYTKIGNRMFFNLYVDVNVIGAGTGAVSIGGLPGTALADARSDSSVSVFADFLTGLTGQHLSGFIAPSTSSVAIFYLLNTRATALPHTVMDAADTVFKITGTYMSAHPA